MSEQDKLKKQWREILIDGRNLSPREAIIEELSEYSGLSPLEIKNTAETSNEISKTVWKSHDRNSEKGLLNFYNEVGNWVFGTLNYHAWQSEQEHVPLPVKAAAAVSHSRPGAYLDFGAGVATAAILFHKLGWTVSIADISKPLLQFAQWRLQRRNIHARCLDLTTDKLEDEKYDLITAFNVFAHIRDIGETLTQLHGALKTGGLLMFDIDARNPGPGNEWFFYRSRYPILQKMRAKGFQRCDPVEDLLVYRKTPHSAVRERIYGSFDRIRYGETAGAVVRRLRGV